MDGAVGSGRKQAAEASRAKQNRGPSCDLQPEATVGAGGGGGLRFVFKKEITICAEKQSCVWSANPVSSGTALRHTMSTSYSRGYDDAEPRFFHGANPV